MTGGDETTKPPMKRLNTQGQVRPGVFLERQTSLWVFGYGSLLWKTNFPYENKVVGHVRSYARRFWLGNTDHRGVPGVVRINLSVACMVMYDCRRNDNGCIIVPYLLLRISVSWLERVVQFSSTPKCLVSLFIILTRFFCVLLQPGRVVTLVKDGEESTWGIAFKVKASEAYGAISYLNGREQGYSTEEVTFYPTDKDMDPITALVYIATEKSSCYLGPASEDAIAKQVVSAKGFSGTNTEYVLNLASSMREIAPHVKDDHLYSLEAKVKELLLPPGKDSTSEDSLREVSSL